MLFKKFIMLLVITIICMPIFATENPSNPSIKNQVSTLVKLISTGEGDFNESDVEVLYTTDKENRKTAVAYFNFGFGSADFEADYIALFGIDESAKKKYHLEAFSQVGSRGWRYYEKFIINRKNQVELTGYFYEKNDSMCCPSKSIKTTFSIENNSIVEINSKTSPLNVKN